MFCPSGNSEFVELGLPLLLMGTEESACYHHVNRRKLADGAVGTAMRLCSRLALLCYQHGALSPEPEKASAPFPGS